MMSTLQAFLLGVMVAWTPTVIWLAISLGGDLAEPTYDDWTA
jgi:hypothetical protein